LSTGINAFPVIVLCFIIIGQVTFLLPDNIMNKTAKEASVIKGIALSSFIGGLIFGGPFIIFPFIASIGKKEGLPLYLFHSCITGKSLYVPDRFLLEFSLIDPFVAIMRYVLALPVPIMVGLLSYLFFKHQNISPVLKQGDENYAPSDHSI